MCASLTSFFPPINTAHSLRLLTNKDHKHTHRNHVNILLSCCNLVVGFTKDNSIPNGAPPPPEHNEAMTTLHKSAFPRTSSACLTHTYTHNTRSRWFDIFCCCCTRTQTRADKARMFWLADVSVCVCFQAKSGCDQSTILRLQKLFLIAYHYLNTMIDIIAMMSRGNIGVGPTNYYSYIRTYAQLFSWPPAPAQ